MLSAYRKLAAEREAQGIPALPLNAEQAKGLTDLLEKPPAGEDDALMHLLTERIPPGVDEAAYVKASWLSAVAQGETNPMFVRTPEERRLWHPIPFRWWSEDQRTRGPDENPTLTQFGGGPWDWLHGPDTDPFFDWPNDPQWWCGVVVD